MKLLIFGATGGTGRELLKQALKRGHNVTAYARNPAKIDDMMSIFSRFLTPRCAS